MKPRLLIISNNPLSETQHNGKTVQSFIEEWEPEQIAQLFFRDEKPCFRTCQNYFCFTDRDALQSWRFKASKNSRYKEYVVHDLVEKKDDSVDHEITNSRDNAIRGIKSKFRQANTYDIAKLARELIWSKSDWNNLQLKRWLDNFKPEVVFLVGGDSVFAYRIADEICREYQVPLMLYVTDDYVTSKFSISPFFYLRLHLIKKSFVKALDKAVVFMTIGKKMSDEYAVRFGKKSIVMMNSVEIIGAKDKQIDKPIRLMYFGGLHFNRWKSLELLGKVLKSLDTVGTLEIYTGSPLTIEMNQALNQGSHCRVMGHLEQSDVLPKMIQADILVHVEAFDKKSVHGTRLSVSTKIPEYMALKRCILGIGPQKIASMEYLKDFAYVVNSQDFGKLKTDIEYLLSHEDVRIKFAEKGYQIAKKNHDITVIREQFTKAVQQAIESKG